MFTVENEKRVVAGALLASTMFASSVLGVDNLKILVNGKEAATTEAEIVDNRTMVPLRFVSEELGAKVDWSEKDKTVQINSTNAIEQAVGKYYEELPDNLNFISVEEAKKKMDNKENVVFVDVRSPEEFNAGHLPNAINIPLKKLGDKMKELPKDKLIIVNCNTGQMSAQAIVGLNLGGYRAYSLLSGFNAWKSMNYPIETTTK